MKEIEIKAHAANHEELKRTIEGLCPLGSIHTSDTYYFSPDQGRDASLFRLRLSGGKGIVTRKQRKRIGTLEVNDEIEYEVSDPEAVPESSQSPLAMRSM